MGLLVKTDTGSAQRGLIRRVVVSKSHCTQAKPAPLLIITQHVSSRSVLVGCKAGANRSSFIVAVILMLMTSEPPEVIERHLVSVRRIVDLRHGGHGERQRRRR